MRGLTDGLDPSSAYLLPDESEGDRSEHAAAGRRRRPGRHASVLPARPRRARRIAGRAGRAADGRLRPHDRRQADARHVGAHRHAPAARRAGLEGLAARHPRQRGRPARVRRSCAKRSTGDGRHEQEAAGRRGVRARRELRRATRPRRSSSIRRDSRKSDGSPGARHRPARRRRRRARRRHRGRAAVRQDRHDCDARRTRTTRPSRSAAPATARSTLPVVLLVSNGTANAAEVFAAALQATSARTWSASPPPGSPRVQRLVKLPEDTGLWMTYRAVPDRPTARPIHERGLRPDVGVPRPVGAASTKLPPDDGRAAGQGHRAAQDQAVGQR